MSGGKPSQPARVHRQGQCVREHAVKPISTPALQVAADSPVPQGQGQQENTLVHSSVHAMLCCASCAVFCLI